MDRADNRMVVTALMALAEALPRGELLRLLEARLLRFDRFRQRLSGPRGTRGLAWEEAPGFELAAHVVEAPPGVGRSEEALRAWLGELMARPLGRAGPLWEVHRVERYRGGTLLVWRIHHAIADGVALLTVLMTATDAPPAPPPRRAARGRAGGLLRRGGHAVRGVVTLGRLAVLGRDEPTLFKGPLSGSKRVAWSEPIPLEHLKAVGRKVDATVNDVLVAALSGALHRYLCARQPGYRGHREVRAVVPVDLRPESSGELLGNRFGTVFLPLPLHAHSAHGRLLATKQRMDALKRTPEALVAFRLLQLMGRAARGLAGLGCSVFSAKATAVLTNVAGPTRPLALAGRRIDDLLFWVPQAGGLGLGLSVFSYAGRVRVGVASDAARVPDPEALVAGFHAELAELEVPGLRPGPQEAGTGGAEGDRRPGGVAAPGTARGVQGHGPR